MRLRKAPVCEYVCVISLNDLNSPVILLIRIDFTDDCNAPASSDPLFGVKKYSSINANNLHFTCKETNEVFSPIMNKETPTKSTMF